MARRAHAVACPDYIWALCDFTEPGVAESCSNAVAWAIEMVGDYRTGGDDPTSGAGAKVVDNACWAIACMAETVEGWGDLSDYAFNKKGLHFHRECRQDHHACPGDLVDKKAMLAMIAKHRATIRGVSAPAPLPRAPSHLFDLSHDTGWQQALKSLHFDIVVDGDFGPKSSTVLEGFQKCAGLKPNGIRTTKTRDSLTKAAG
jgi:putative peptidoglycan binding protein